MKILLTRTIKYFFEIYLSKWSEKIILRNHDLFQSEYPTVLP